MYAVCMSPKGAPREQRFNFMMSDEERAMLDTLAAADNRTAGDWLRVAIRTAHGARFGAKKPKAQK